MWHTRLTGKWHWILGNFIFCLTRIEHMTWRFCLHRPHKTKKLEHILDTKDKPWILGKKYYFNVQDFLLVGFCFPTKHTAQCLSVCLSQLHHSKKEFVSCHLRLDFFACFYFMYTLCYPAGYMWKEPIIYKSLIL